MTEHEIVVHKCRGTPCLLRINGITSGMKEKNCNAAFGEQKSCSETKEM